MAKKSKAPSVNAGGQPRSNRGQANVPTVGEATRWKPGQSGNPAGRPRSSTQMKQQAASMTDGAMRILALQQQIAERRLQAVVDILDDPNATPEQKLEALAMATNVGLDTAREILDRGHGKPQQKVEMTSADVFADMTPEEKLAYIIENTPKVLAGLKGR